MYGFRRPVGVHRGLALVLSLALLLPAAVSAEQRGERVETSLDARLAPIAHRLPFVRFGHTAVADPANHRTIVFGGSNGWQFFNSVWALDLTDGSEAWSQVRTRGPLPPARGQHSAIYDGANQRMIVYGGHSRYHNFRDVWALDLTPGAERWSKLFPDGDGPGARRWHTAIYDAPRSRMVVFGGGGSGTMFNDVWALDLTPGTEAWSLVTVVGAPPAARTQHTAVHDAAGQRMVVFGGRDADAVLSDTWMLDLATDTWSQPTPAGPPPDARRGHTAVADPDNSRMIVFGGLGSAGFQNDTWTLSLAPGTLTWSQLSPAGSTPGTRAWHSATMDDADGRVLVIGGRGMSSLQGEAQWSLDLASSGWTQLSPQLPGGSALAASSTAAPSQAVLPPDASLAVEDAPPGTPVTVHYAWQGDDPANPDLLPEVWFVVTLRTTRMEWADDVEVALTAIPTQFEVIDAGTRSDEWDAVSWGILAPTTPMTYLTSAPRVYTATVDLSPEPVQGFGKQVIFKTRLTAYGTGGGLGDAFVSVEAGAADWPWTVSETAVVRRENRPQGWVVVNRSLLYDTYHRYEVRDLLAEVFEQIEASGRTLAVIYADRYVPSLSEWDNTDVNYYDELTANVVAAELASWLDAWRTFEILTWQGGAEVTMIGVDALPPYVVILGDDNVIPFYRKWDYGTPGAIGDQTEDDSPNCWGDEELCDELVSHNFYLTDNPYGVNSVQLRDWEHGQVDAAVGRIVGATAADMRTFFENASQGPNEDQTRAILMSGGLDWWVPGADNDPQNVLKGYMGYQLNEDLLDSNATKAEVLAEMEKGFAVMAAAERGETYTCKVPAGGGFPAGYLVSYEIPDYDPDGLMATNRPFFHFNASRVGFSYTDGWHGDEAYDDTMVYSLIHNGASGIIAPAGKVYGSFDNNVLCASEILNNDVWTLAKARPTLSDPLGWCLKQAKRRYAVTTDRDRKTVQTFTYFGLPWMRLHGHGVTLAGASEQPKQVDGASPLWSAPAALGDLSGPARSRAEDPSDRGPTMAPMQWQHVTAPAASYVVTASVDASTYDITTTTGGFDLIDVQNLAQRAIDGQVVLPQATLDLVLSLSATISNLVFTPTQDVALPDLDIPTLQSGVAIPDGPTGGYTATMPGVYPVSATVQSRMLEGYQSARVVVTPVTYDATSDQATLYRHVDVAVTYESPETLALTDFGTDKTEYAPGQTIEIAASIANVGEVSETVTPTLLVQDSSGTVVGLQQAAPIEVPSGGTHDLSVTWTGPLEGDAYRVWLVVSQGGQVQAVASGAITIRAGELRTPVVPETLWVGEEGTFEVQFENVSGDPTIAFGSLAVYDEHGDLVEFVPGEVQAVAGGAGETLSFSWAPDDAGSYTASFVATSGGQEYGPRSEPFTVRHGVYLPLVLRGD